MLSPTCYADFGLLLIASAALLFQSRAAISLAMAADGLTACLVAALFAIEVGRGPVYFSPGVLVLYAGGLCFCTRVAVGLWKARRRFTAHRR